MTTETVPATPAPAAPVSPPPSTPPPAQTPPPVYPTAESERLRILKDFGFPVDPDASALPPIIPPPPIEPDPSTPPAAPPAPAPGTDPAAAPAAPAATPPPGAPAEPPAAERPPRKVESAAEVAARAIQEAADRISKPKEEEKEAPDGPDEESAFRLQALEILEKHPKFAGRDLRGEYTAYMGKVSAYEEAWKKANPGREFDLDDGEHDAWCEKNEPDISEEDIRTAEAQVGTLRVVDERQKKRDEAVFGKRLALEQAQSTAQSVEDILTIVDPASGEVKKYATIDELSEADPILAHEAAAFIPKAAEISAAVVALLTPGSPVAVDPANPAHREVLRQVALYEEQVMSWPPEQRFDGLGRQYVPEKEYARLKPAEREKVWTFRYSPKEVRALAIHGIRGQMQATAFKLRTELEKKKAAATGTPTAPAAQAPTPPPTSVPPRSSGTGPATIPTPTAPQPSRPGAFWGR